MRDAERSRYASLYFCMGVSEDDNELLVLEIIHRYVELLDKYFESVCCLVRRIQLTCWQVCELDVIFNFEKARRRWAAGA